MQEAESNGATPLHIAVRAGRVALVELLITEGASVNAKDSQSRSPYELAKLMQHQEIIQVGLKRAALVL